MRGILCTQGKSNDYNKKVAEKILSWLQQVIAAQPKKVMPVVLADVNDGFGMDRGITGKLEHINDDKIPEKRSLYQNR